jgi:hypothetical protein
MGVFLTILLVVALFVCVVHELIFIIDRGIPPKDKDMIEMLEKYKDTYSKLDRKYNDQFTLESNVDRRAGKGPKIIRFNCSILWLGYIEDIGVLPRWYKSSKILKQLFDQQIKASSYSVTKRDKLGL